MSILNLLPVALVALGLVLRWYQFAPAKPQRAMVVSHFNAKKNVVKTRENQLKRGVACSNAVYHSDYPNLQKLKIADGGV